MRTKALSTLGLAVLILVGLAPTPAAAQAGTVRIPAAIDLSAVRQLAPDIAVLDATCADLRACIWENAYYGGSKLVFLGSDEGLWQTNFTIRSAKNHFNNRAVGFYNINTGERVRCSNPDTNRPGPFPDATRLVVIGGAGSRC
jgi:hypothetical protein